MSLTCKANVLSWDNLCTQDLILLRPISNRISEQLPSYLSAQSGKAVTARGRGGGRQPQVLSSKAEDENHLLKRPFVQGEPVAFPSSHNLRVSCGRLASGNSTHRNRAMSIDSSPSWKGSPSFSFCPLLPHLPSMLWTILLWHIACIYSQAWDLRKHLSYTCMHFNSHRVFHLRCTVLLFAPSPATLFLRCRPEAKYKHTVPLSAIYIYIPTSHNKICPSVSPATYTQVCFWSVYMSCNKHSHSWSFVALGQKCLLISTRGAEQWCVNTREFNLVSSRQATFKEGWSSQKPAPQHLPVAVLYFC